MRLIAVSNISNGRITLGFRLLDIDTKQTKDVSLADVKDAIQSGNLQIENLTIKDEIVIGSNGSIDRLPKLVNKQLVGKSPLIILNRVGSEGYKVSDFKGTILNMGNSDALAYAQTHGISNGKITGKGSGKFISSINGTYKVIRTKIAKNSELYTGTLDNSTKPLLPILTTFTKSKDIVNEHTVISYSNGKEITSKHANNQIEIDLNDIRKRLMHECSGYTLVRCVVKELEITNEKDKTEIVKILKTEEFRDSVEESIYNHMSKYAGESCESDEETGLAFPTPDRTYESIIDNKNIIDSETSYNELTNEVSKETIARYVKYLGVMQARIYSQFIAPFKKIALARKCSKEGISYSVYTIEIYNKESRVDVSLEDIYHYNKEYDNAIVTGTELKIVGLDGVYTYDMNFIHKIYHRAVVESNRNLKAALVDPLYNEGINEQGELNRFRCGSSIMIIPKTVKSIQYSSILVLKHNTRIIFGDHIERCDSDCFNTESDSELSLENIEFIEIYCKNAVQGIIESLGKIAYSINEDATIYFDCDITTDDYVTLIYSGIDLGMNYIENKNEPDDKFVLDILKKVIETKLGGLHVLKKSIPVKRVGEQLSADEVRTNAEYNLLLENHNIFMRQGSELLTGRASNNMDYKLEKMYKAIQKQIDFREKEYKENIAKIKSKG